MAENKKNTVKTAAIKQPPLRDIDFQVDTVSVEQTDGAAAYYSSAPNTVTTNYVKGDSFGNKFNNSDTALLHEQKHRDNYNQGLYEYPVSPEMAYKLNMHNEISANMVELLYLRQKYLQTGDLSIFEKEEGGRYIFYKEAVDKGEIKPRSPYQEDFDKEMRLIANGTQKMWLQEFGDTYINQNSSNGAYYGDKSGKYAQYYDQNYKHSRKIALTIGGVDFTKYLDKDVEIPEKGKSALQQRLLYPDKEDYNLSNTDLCKKYDLPPYDGSMSIQQYQNLLQHTLYCKHLETTGGISTLRMQADIKADENITGEKYPDMLQKQKQEASEFVKDKSALISCAVQAAARDYAEKGEKIPAGNDKAYNAAVDKLYTQKYNIAAKDKIYTGSINVRQDMMPENKLPFNALNNNTKNIIEENKNLWNRVKAKTTYFFNKTFSSDKKEEVKNQPINPVDKNKKPEYRQWEDKDGSRVSEVQHRKLPDMTKDVIQKPTKSYAAEQKTTPDDKEKMVAIINYMNKINGANKSVNAEKTVADLTQTYGDKALTLLQMAVNEPNNYAQYVGDASLKTSRAAVEHLCNIPEPEKAAEAIIKREISPNYKPELKQQMKDAAQKAKTQNKAPTKNKMKSDFEKYLAAKQNLVAQNDAIPAIRKQVERTAQIGNTAKRKIQPNLLKLKQKQQD